MIDLQFDTSELHNKKHTIINIESTIDIELEDCNRYIEEIYHALDIKISTEKMIDDIKYTISKLINWIVYQFTKLMLKLRLLVVNMFNNIYTIDKRIGRNVEYKLYSYFNHPNKKKLLLDKCKDILSISDKLHTVFNTVLSELNNNFDLMLKATEYNIFNLDKTISYPSMSVNTIYGIKDIHYMFNGIGYYFNGNNIEEYELVRCSDFENDKIIGKDLFKFFNMFKNLPKHIIVSHDSIHKIKRKNKEILNNNNVDINKLFIISNTIPSGYLKMLIELYKELCLATKSTCMSTPKGIKEIRLLPFARTEYPVK